MTTERLVEIRGIAERTRNVNTCRLSLSAFSPHATGAVVVLQPEEVISLADDLIATRAELAELRRVVTEAVAAMRARIEAPDATVLTWDYILACALDDEPVNDIVSEPVDQWVTRALRNLIATASTEQEGA